MTSELPYANGRLHLDANQAWAELHLSNVARPVYVIGQYAMLPVEPMRYLRTDVCAAFVPCDQCGSAPGVPCRGMRKGRGVTYPSLPGDNWIVGTHWNRRNDFVKLPAKGAAP